MDPMRLILRWSIVCLAFSAPVAYAQVPVDDPDLVGGPWEFTGASGIDGIYLQINAMSHRSPEQQQSTYTGVNVRVYHREAGKETGGWFGATNWAIPESHVTSFNGKRLVIHFENVRESRRIDVDLTFSPTSRTWTGTWSRDGSPALPVVLERPHQSPGNTVNAFVGDWEGEPDPRFPPKPTALHVRQASDGALSAWLDLTSSAMECKARSIQTNQSSGGALLRVSSPTDDVLIVETGGDFGPSYRFRGTLSQDGRELTGAWENLWGSGPQIGITASFHRVEGSAGMAAQSR